jgi:hypothetical protein
MDDYVYQRVYDCLSFGQQKSCRLVNRRAKTVIDKIQYGSKTVCELLKMRHYVPRSVVVGDYGPIQLLDYASTNGHLKLMEYVFDQKRLEPSQLYRSFKKVCRAGHRNLFNYILLRTASDDSYFVTYEVGLRGACRGGHYDLFLELLSLSSIDCGKFMYDACRGGHRLIVDYIFKHASTIDSYSGLIGACRGGQYDLVVRMLSLGATPRFEGFMDACRGGHYEIVSLLKGDIDTCAGGLRASCRGGHRELVDLMLEWGATDFSGGLVSACYRGNHQIINLMLQLGAHDYDKGLVEACRGGHLDCVDWMLQLGATDLNGGIQGAYNHGHSEIVLYLTELSWIRQVT